MPIPPRISAIALRTTDLARSTAFYVALGWELSPASTTAMSLFKTAGSLLLVCTDELLTELGGQQVAAALAGHPTGEAVLSIHVASDGEVDAALQEAARAGGVVVKPAAPPRWAVPMGSSPTPTAMCGRSSTTRSTSSGPTDGPRSRRPWHPLEPCGARVGPLCTWGSGRLGWRNDSDTASLIDPDNTAVTCFATDSPWLHRSSTR